MDVCRSSPYPATFHPPHPAHGPRAVSRPQDHCPRHAIPAIASGGITGEGRGPARRPGNATPWRRAAASTSTTLDKPNSSTQGGHMRRHSLRGQRSACVRALAEQRRTYRQRHREGIGRQEERRLATGLTCSASRRLSLHALPSSTAREATSAQGTHVLSSTGATWAREGPALSLDDDTLRCGRLRRGGRTPLAPAVAAADGHHGGGGGRPGPLRRRRGQQWRLHLRDA